MKKIILLLPLLLFPLAGCKKVEVNANMYEIKDWIYEEEVKDYKYEILNTYDEYQHNKNQHCLHHYEEYYFESNTLIIIYLYEYNSGFKWKITNCYKTGNQLSLEISNEAFEMQPVLSASAYCVEIGSKKIKKIELERIY